MTLAFNQQVLRITQTLENYFTIFLVFCSLVIISRLGTLKVIQSKL